MSEMAMFPLGSVLFPGMPTALHLFEERYLVMLSRLLQQNSPEFAIVLIERGTEAGGGETRFDTATVARITQLQSATDGSIDLVAEGIRRVEVDEWLPDDPHPRAVVHDLPELGWDDSLLPLREEAERVVRRELARASEFANVIWSPDVVVSDDPVEAAWQLAGIAPLGQLDQQTLLRSPTMERLLTDLVRLTVETAEMRAAFEDDELSRELDELSGDDED
jgi:Lon protease-like protein